MITQTETGLSTLDYGLLANKQESPKFSVVLSRWNLDFGDTSYYSSSHIASNDGIDFDAIVLGSKLMRVTHPVICEVFDGASWVSTTIPSAPGSLLAKLSLTSNGIDTIYLYYMSTDGIYVVTTGDFGSTWSSWTLAYSFGFSLGDANAQAVLLIAAVEPGYVFWIEQDLTTKVNNLRYSIPDSGLLITHGLTDIAFVTPPRSLAAVLQSLPEDPHHCFVMMTEDTPGQTSAKLVNGQVSTFILRAGGIISFECLNGQIGEHINVDMFDQINSWRYRENVTVSKIGDKIFVTSASGDGNENYPFRQFRYYTSQDGRWWSNGFIIPNAPSNAQRGFKLLKLGNYIYGVMRQDVWRSTDCDLTGVYPTPVNITDSIDSYEVEQADMQQSGLVVNNESGQMDQFNNTKDTWTITYKWGYDSPHGPVLIPNSIHEVDSFEFTKQIDESSHEYLSVVKITSRDKTAQMVDKVMSEQAHYWQSQQISADSFEDNTTTSYGGLQHTATQTGSFETKNETLLLATNNTEGISFNTFSTDLWNGSIELGFRLSKASNNEYAGVVFRAIDKDNLWYSAYIQSSDSISIVERRGGIDTVKLTTSSLGWSTDILTQYRFIRVNFRYARITMFYSMDGFTWLTGLTYTMDGAFSIPESYLSLEFRPVERGYVGTIGKGYSTLDQWASGEDSIPTPVIDSNPEFSTLQTGGTAWAMDDNNHMARTYNFSDTSNWESIIGTGLTGNIYDLCLSPRSAWWGNPSTSTPMAAWATTTTGLFYSFNVNTSSPVWVQMQTASLSGAYENIIRPASWAEGELCWLTKDSSRVVKLTWLGGYGTSTIWTRTATGLTTNGEVGFDIDQYGTNGRVAYFSALDQACCGYNAYSFYRCVNGAVPTLIYNPGNARVVNYFLQKPLKTFSGAPNNQVGNGTTEYLVVSFISVDTSWPGILAYTDNGGNTWHAIQPPASTYTDYTNVPPNSTSFVATDNSNTIITFSGYVSRLFTTISRGGAWLQPSSVGATLASLSLIKFPHSANYSIGGCGGHYAFLSPDLGVTIPGNYFGDWGTSQGSGNMIKIIPVSDTYYG